MEKNTEQWTSKFGFVMAAAGSAIGLGAIWKFPYVVGTNGGGAFLFIFLIFTLFIGLPILLAEFIIGRGSQKDAISAYQSFSPESNWDLIGKIGVFASFILLSFYSVVGGWIIIYFFQVIKGELSNLNQNQYSLLFHELISAPVVPVLAQLIFMLITILIVSKGIKKGIERASKFMMPALFISFIILIIRSLTLSGVIEGLSFFLYPNFSDITSKTILDALGQSFFALSVGLSCMVTYSSYLSKNENLSKSALLIVIMNISISLLAGIAIFPAVFSFGFEPTEGPSLLFVILPAVFDKMPFGLLFLVIFLFLFLFATLTSSFSLLEVIVASLIKGDNSKRRKATWIAGTIIFLIGIPSTLSFGVLKGTTLFGKTMFDLEDFLISNILLPIGALAIAIFVQFKIPKDILFKEINAGTINGKRWFACWFLLIKYLVPLAIIIVILNMTGVLSFLGDALK